MHNSTKTTPLKPLPMRVTERQYERLKAQRAKDGYTVQELVRRALDYFLDAVEQEDLASRPAVPGDVKPSKAAISRQASQTAKVAKPTGKRVRSQPSAKVIYR